MLPSAGTVQVSTGTTAPVDAPDAPGWWDRPVIPAYYDTVFRWVFGTAEHVQVLGGFLRAAMADLPAHEWTGAPGP